jgi:hypothetical protein
MGALGALWRFQPVGQARTAQSWTADAGWAQLKLFAIIQSLFQLVEMLQVRNYKTQPFYCPKFSKLGKVIDKFNLHNFPF